MTTKPHIKRELMKVTLITVAIVALLACGTLFAYQYFALRDAAVRSIGTLATVTAIHSSAALAFNNPEDATSTLSALKAEPQIVRAALYDQRGQLFAMYPEGTIAADLPRTIDADGHRFTDGHIVFFQSVNEDDHRLGTLYLQFSMQAIFTAFWLYGIVVVVVVLLALAIAYSFSNRLQSHISRPILALAETAKAVSERGDYGVRAKEPEGYELGLLTDAFNHMLARIQEQVGRLDLLQRITRAIAERQDLSSIFRVVIANIEDNLPVDFGCACLYDSLERVATVVAVGRKSEALAQSIDLSERVRIAIDTNGLSRAVQGQLVYEPDVTVIDFQLPQQLARGGLRSVVLAPLLVENKVFGVLIAARRGKAAFSSGDCEFLRQLSELVALASRQAQLNTALQQAYDDLHQSQHTVMQQERLRALGQMASGIAHDINNAISPVALYTESLLEREPNLSERARSYLVTIQQAIGDVAQTVSRMREFYRHRQPELLLTSIQLDRLAQQVIDLTRARWSDLPQQHGIVINLRTEFEADLPLTMGAEAEIRDALTNLIFNAVDAMPEGGALTVRTKHLESDSGTPSSVAIEVTDSGVGMTEETRQRCLEPFFTTKGERGTGLGLAMVYGMVQRHSATLEIDSTVNVGTTMRLIFPIATQPLNTSITGSRPAITQRLRILTVDDDPLLVKSLKDALEADGHIVVAADGGQAGIDAFSNALKSGQHFDVVFTDLGMPYIDGRKVAAMIKTLSLHTPIIMLTGWGQRMIAENDVPLHVDRVLSKPPRLTDIRMALSELTAAVGSERSNTDSDRK